MIVVRMLLNSCATLDASAPTLESRCACNNCWRSWSASVVGASTPLLVMHEPPRLGQAALSVGRATPDGVSGASPDVGRQSPLANGIGCAAQPTSLEVSIGNDSALG